MLLSIGFVQPIGTTPSMADISHSFSSQTIFVFICASLNVLGFTCFLKSLQELFTTIPGFSRSPHLYHTEYTKSTVTRKTIVSRKNETVNNETLTVVFSFCTTSTRIMTSITTPHLACLRLLSSYRPTVPPPQEKTVILYVQFVLPS